MGFSLTGAIPAIPQPQRTAEAFVAGQAIIGLDASVPDALDRLFADLPGASLIQELAGSPGAVLIALPEGLEVPDAIVAIAALGYVNYAEPNGIMTIQVGIPSNPDDDLATSPPRDSSGEETPEIVMCRPFLPFETFTEEIRDAGGQLTGRREITSGPGFNSVVEYDSAGNFVYSAYSDSDGNRFETRRETLLDDAGLLIGYRDTSSGSGRDSNSRSLAVFDADFNLVEASHSDSSGYNSQSLRSEIRDESGELIGYELSSSGSAPDGYRFSSRETFDAAYQLLESEFESSDGYHSSYRLEIQRDESGEVTGYVTTYAWTDGVSAYTTADRFDAHWNYLGGDSLRPDIVVDDGPQIMPVIAAGAPQSAAAAREALSGSTIDTQADGASGEGARLQGDAGDNTFYVDDRRDRITKDAGGEDMVMSDSVSIDLMSTRLKPAEHASLIGRESLSLRGDNGNNELSGNAGDNRIDGGNGRDDLFGGFGDDVFVIRASARHADRVNDFTVGEDALALTGSAFHGLFAGGELREGVLGDRLLFDAETGELSFDRDGAAGSRGAVVVAVLVGVSDLDADDFIAG